MIIDRNMLNTTCHWLTHNVSLIQITMICLQVGAMSLRAFHLKCPRRTPPNFPTNGFEALLTDVSRHRLGANVWMNYGLKVVFVCLHITVSQSLPCRSVWRQRTHKIIGMFIVLRMCLTACHFRWPCAIFSQTQGCSKNKLRYWNQCNM